MTITELIDKIRLVPGCTVDPPVGLPNVGADFMLPVDLQEFYQLTGGVRLFDNSGTPIKIVSPNEVVQADPVILVGIDIDHLVYAEGETSWSWHILADGGSGEYVTIDLSRERLGRCYNSGWTDHPGNSTIIAKSFTEFLERLIDGGDEWYWYKPGSQSYGHAYS